MRYLIPVLVLVFNQTNSQSFVDYFRSPVFYKVEITNGYDSNVLRFSSEEKQNAILQPELLGGAKTFDSHYFRAALTGQSTFHLRERKKRISLKLQYNRNIYTHNKNKNYWSGNFKLAYHWGTYKRIEYSLHRLNNYYLRQYINRDVSGDKYTNCTFTDLEQQLLLSYPVYKQIWFNVYSGYLQRYNNSDFTEFDLDIFFSGVKFNQRVMKTVTTAIQMEYGLADNISRGQTARASLLDRSYRYFKTYLPLKLNFDSIWLQEIGISLRTEHRSFIAEEINDPLHSGRDHTDSKINIWIKKKLKESIRLTAQIQYRNRTTQSIYNWVEELKSFNQIQTWLRVEWNLVYDTY